MQDKCEEASYKKTSKYTIQACKNIDFDILVLVLLCQISDHMKQFQSTLRTQQPRILVTLINIISLGIHAKPLCAFSEFYFQCSFFFTCKLCPTDYGPQAYYILKYSAA